MTFDGTLHYTYDAWNRLVGVHADDGGDPGDLVAVYGYDGQGYRISKAVALYGDLEYPTTVTGYDRTDYYFNGSWQVLEERFTPNQAAAGTVAATPNVQYVWDQRYIDTPICRLRDANLDYGDEGSDGLEEVLYYATDANMNVKGKGVRNLFLPLQSVMLAKKDEKVPDPFSPNSRLRRRECLMGGRLALLGCRMMPCKSGGARQAG